MDETITPVDYDANRRYWLFNTDESEKEGVGAYQHMLNQSVIAAWGNCKGVGAERTLNRPEEGETVFFYLAGTGVIAAGEVEGLAFSASTVFGQHGEYHRRVINLRRKTRRPLTFADVRENTGYSLPVHGCIVCHMQNETAVRYVLQYFNVGPYG